MLNNILNLLMDINKDINEYFKNDVILLLMEFLYSENLLDSLITIEKETKLSIFSYNTLKGKCYEKDNYWYTFIFCYCRYNNIHFF